MGQHFTLGAGPAQIMGQHVLSRCTAVVAYGRYENFRNRFQNFLPKKTHFRGFRAYTCGALARLGLR